MTTVFLKDLEKNHQYYEKNTRRFFQSNGEIVIADGKIVGYTTSSNFSFYYNKNICLAYINHEITDNDELFVEVEGERYALNLEKQAIHDPRSEKLRS